MKLKKFLAGITALLCCSGVLAFMPEFASPASAEETVYNDFEVSFGGWYADSDISLLNAVENQGFENSRALQISGRKTAQDGVSSSKGFYLYGGVNYHYSVKVFSNTDETFRLSLLCKDLNTGEETLKELDVKDSKAGTWTELSADDIAPANSYEFKVSIRSDSTNDFIFDEFKVTTEDTSALKAVAANDDLGLKDVYKQYFKVGNILNSGTVRNSAITANILKNYNSIECENETKPDATINRAQCSGTNVAVQLNSAAAIMDFCCENNIPMRGHTLVWHSQTPSWLFKTDFSDYGQWVDKNTMDARMESYIKNMFNAIKTQYPKLDLYAYDVCNECVSDSDQRTKNNGGAREAGDNNVTRDGKSAWVQVYGDNSFVEKAFTYARKYAPESCKLYYNDYNEYWDHKRDCIYNMCKSLYEKGLLDGVGMQSHVPANATGFAGTDSYIEAMHKYLSIGCDVQITELDISLNKGQYSLQDQADKYKAIFQAAMDWNKNPQSSGKVTAVCIWGPNDANSWLESGSDALLFDKNNQPKLAYTTLMNLIPSDNWDVEPTQKTEPAENGFYFEDTFEGSTNSWAGRGEAKVSTTTKTVLSGNSALFVDGRTSAWNGASKALSSSTFSAGNAYSFSVAVNYTDGGASDTFYLKLQYTDASGKEQYDTIAEATVVKGEWTQLANKNYKLPAGASNMQIYVETAETTNSFYLDEAAAATAGTVIKTSASQQVPVIASNIDGDVNGDGIINIYDFLLAKKYLLQGKYSEAADVDDNGKLETADLVQIQKYLMGKISKFTKSEIVVAPTEAPTEKPTEQQHSSTDGKAYMDSIRASLTYNIPAEASSAVATRDYGTVVPITYYSTIAKKNKGANVLLPAGYNENETYPVLYVNHGIFGDQNSMLDEGMKIKTLAGNLAASGEAEKMIIVFTAMYTSENSDICSGFTVEETAKYDAFREDLIECLMPYINEHYSTKTGREYTGISGFSMGGRETLYIGVTRPEYFGYIGAACPAPGVTPGADNLMSHPGNMQESEFKITDAANQPYMLFIAGGTNDGVVNPFPSNYHKILTANGQEHLWLEVPGGGHDGSTVAPMYYNLLRNIFKAN